MRKIVLATVLLLSTQAIFAQDGTKERIFKPFKVDVSLGFASPQGAGTKGGILFVVEPKYAVIDALAVGLRMETAVMARGIVGSGGQAVSATVSANASYLATADYYLSNKGFRPFLGAGAGMYTLASAELDSNDPNVPDNIPAERKFGFMARGGFEAGHFRLGVEYNFIPQSSGGVQNNYLGIKLGAVIGGGRR